MAKPRSFFSRGRKILTADRFVHDMQRAGLVLQRAGSGDGREWVVDGSTLKNFASCSYMGLERHPELLAAAERALREFGSNFSISRVYLQCPLYEALESSLERIMERHVIVAPSTTMAHLAALPVVVGDHDLVLVDQFVHASVHMATELIADVPIELVRHNRLDLLEQRLAEAGDAVERVWYLCDGIYSMLGDFAPFAGLRELLSRYPKLHLYVDDAHGMSWMGKHGRGSALTELVGSDRVIAAVSLSKAFGATGGAVAFPSSELRDRVRRSGGPMLFSGPIPPAALGAAAASAELHLRPEFDAMQAELAERMRLTRTRLAEKGLTMTANDATPIFMIQFDSAPAVAGAVTALRERGFYCCVSTFPAVPICKPSIRFTVSRHNSFEDIEALIEELYQAVAKREEKASAAETARHPSPML